LKGRVAALALAGVMALVPLRMVAMMVALAPAIVVIAVAIVIALRFVVVIAIAIVAVTVLSAHVDLLFSAEEVSGTAARDKRGVVGHRRDRRGRIAACRDGEDDGNRCQAACGHYSSSVLGRVVVPNSVGGR